MQTTITNYRLIAGYSGTAGDSIMHNSDGHNLNGMAFSTHDRDNDQDRANCANLFSPWWHNSCMCSTLNGRYHHDTSIYFRGINWVTFTSGGRSLKFSEMKLKTRD